MPDASFNIAQGWQENSTLEVTVTPSVKQISVACFAYNAVSFHSSLKCREMDRFCVESYRISGLLNIRAGFIKAWEDEKKRLEGEMGVQELLTERKKVKERERVKEKDMESWK